MNSQTKSQCVLLRCGSHLLQVGFDIEIQGGAGISVSQNLLNALDVSPATQEQTGTGVAQIVGRHIWKPRSLDKPLHVPGDGTWITRLKGIAWTAENKGSREQSCGMLPLLLLLELLQESQGAWNNRDRADRVGGFGLCHSDTAFRGVGGGAVHSQGSILEVDIRPLKSQTFAPAQSSSDKDLEDTPELKITGQQSIEEPDGFILCQSIDLPL